MKARVLIDDGIERFKKGDIGEVIENDFDKYDHLLDFGTATISQPVLGVTVIRRLVYFYKHEIKITEGVIMNGYIAISHKGEKHEVYANTSYEAQQKAIEYFKPPKSKKHLISVYLCEVDGKEVTQSTCF